MEQVLEQVKWQYPDESIYMPGNEVHIWLTSMENESQYSIKRLHSLLTGPEKKRAAGYVFEKDQKRFIIGRGYLRIILGMYMGIDPGECAITCNRFGKPELDGIGRYGLLRFNLSHSCDKIIYAVSMDREVGIDIERIDCEMKDVELVNSFFSNHEKKEYACIPEDGRKEAFYVCWTRKEAYVKAYGMGLSLPFDAFSVSMDPYEPSIYKYHELEKHNSKKVYLYDVPFIEGYASALAAEGRNLSCKYWHCNL